MKGETEESLPYYEEAERLYEKFLLPGDYRFAGLYNNLALALSDTGDYKNAEAYFMEAMSIMETLPEIELRTNGIGMGNIQTGHFRLEGTGPCRLYVNLRFSPFVQLVLDDGEIIIFNTSEKDRTMELYESCVELCMSGTAGTGEIEE